MSPTQKKRFAIVAAILIGVALSVGLMLKAISTSVEYFRTPSQINNGEYTRDQTYRIAGLVRKGSVQRLEDGVTQQFTITDCVEDVRIQYTGILPDLFREGQAIVTLGAFTKSVSENTASGSEPMMVASQVLAKHDENYVPSEAADAVMLAQANKCDDAPGAVKY